MKLGYKALFILSLCFILGLLLWALFAPKEDISKRIYATLKEQEKRADMSFSNVSFEEIDAGIRYWQLKAQKAMLNKNTGVATLQLSRGAFYKNNRPSLRFFSPAALWDMNKKEIYLDQPIGYDPSLEKNIKALAQKQVDINTSLFNFPRLKSDKNNFWFKANNLSWKLAYQKLICNGKIILKKGEITGFADKLEADVDLDNVLLSGQPFFTIEDPRRAPVTVEAQQIEARNKEDQIIASGSPQILWKDAIVTAQHIKYLQKDNCLQLLGQIKITYKDIIAWGNSANYFTKDNRVEIIGNAHATQGDNNMQGDKVIVSLNEQKVSVAGKGKIVIIDEKVKP